MIFFLALLDFAHAAEMDVDKVTKLVITQAFNFTIYVGVLTFLLRKKIRAYLGKKQSDFLEAVQKAEVARESAEVKNKSMQEKINKIQAEYESLIANASTRAEKAAQDLVSSAKLSAEKLKKDAENNLMAQRREAIHKLKAELLASSVNKTKEDLKSKMQKQDHVIIQDNLVKSFGVTK